MPSTKRPTLSALLKPFARFGTTSNDALDVRTAFVSTPALSATTTLSLFYAEGDCYLHSIRFVSNYAVTSGNWSVAAQNAGTGGSGSTAIGSAYTGAHVAQDAVNIYAPADGYSTVISAGQVVKAVCTETAGAETFGGVFIVNFIPIVV